MSALNDSFGVGTYDQIDFDAAFSGYYCRGNYYYNNANSLGPPWINRNTAVGRAIPYGGGNYDLNSFYSYNDIAKMHWSFNFINNSSGKDVSLLQVYYDVYEIYSQILYAQSEDNISDSDIGVFSVEYPVSLLLTDPCPAYVDINLYDTDTTVTIYAVTTANCSDYFSQQTLGNVYGFQRFTLDLTFYD